MSIRNPLGDLGEPFSAATKSVEENWLPAIAAPIPGHFGAFHAGLLLNRIRRDYEGPKMDFPKSHNLSHSCEGHYATAFPDQERIAA